MIIDRWAQPLKDKVVIDGVTYNCGKILAGDQSSEQNPADTPVAETTISDAAVTEGSDFNKQNTIIISVVVIVSLLVLLLLYFTLILPYFSVDSCLSAIW